MAGHDERDPQQDAPGPDLELPSLFRRRSRRRDRGATDPATPETPMPPVHEGATDDTATPTQPLRPVPGAVRRPPTPPPSAPPTAAAPPPEPTPETTPEPDPAPDPRPEPGTGARETPPSGRPSRPWRRGPEMTWSGADRPASTPVAPETSPVAVADTGYDTDVDTDGTDTETRRRRPSLPDLSPRVAAVVAGIAVAATGIAVVWLSLAACTAVRGVSTCGGIGLLGIVLTLVAQAAVGTLLLGALGVSQARSTAVLGVGVASFVAMVLLYAGVGGVWLSGALLVATPAAFLLAEGVTSGRFSDP